jgi:hypothetical protein
MLRQLLGTCDRTARGRRDRAQLLFGFAGALRRPELVALRVKDVKGTPTGCACGFCAARPGRARGGDRPAARQMMSPPDSSKPQPEGDETDVPIELLVPSQPSELI